MASHALRVRPTMLVAAGTGERVIRLGKKVRIASMVDGKHIAS